MCVCVLVMRRRASTGFVSAAQQRRVQVDNKQTVIHEAHRLAVSDWRASHVLAWLQVDMNMPAYGQACFDNIKSGKVAQQLLLSLLLYYCPR